MDCFYNLVVPNILKAREILRWVREVPGVLEARMELFEDIETIYDIFDEELASRFGGILEAADSPLSAVRVQLKLVHRDR